MTPDSASLREVFDRNVKVATHFILVIIVVFVFKINARVRKIRCAFVILPVIRFLSDRFKTRFSKQKESEETESSPSFPFLTANTREEHCSDRTTATKVRHCSQLQLHRREAIPEQVLVGIRTFDQQASFCFLKAAVSISDFVLHGKKSLHLHVNRRCYSCPIGCARSTETLSTFITKYQS